MSSADEDRSESSASRGRTWSRVRSIGLRAYRVELGGSLRPGWLASLGLELAAQHISIDRASGRRGPKGVWSAELEIIQLASASDPTNLPFAHLAETGRTSDASVPIVLDRYTLTESTQHPGCLELEFEATDSLGLLGRVLAALALLVLFPVELRIETRAGRVQDRLTLGGINGAAPSPEARMRLEQLMVRLTRRTDPALK